MTRTVLLGLIAVVGSTTTAGSAKAGGFTVYIWNVNANNGWVRSGTGSYNGIVDIYTSKANCLASINQRVNGNKRYRQDWEAFAVIQTNQRPGPGYLNRTNVPGGWSGAIRYVPPNQWYNVKAHPPAATSDAVVRAPLSAPAVRRGREDVSV